MGAECFLTRECCSIDQSDTTIRRTHYLRGFIGLLAHLVQWFIGLLSYCQMKVHSLPAPLVLRRHHCSMQFCHRTVVLTAIDIQCLSCHGARYDACFVLVVIKSQTRHSSLTHMDFKQFHTIAKSNVTPVVWRLLNNSTLPLQTQNLVQVHHTYDHHS